MPKVSQLPTAALPGVFYVIEGGVSKKITLGTMSTQNLTNGTWTPAVTAIANASAVSGNLCLYSRIGNIVNVSGSINITPSAAGVVVTVEMSLPIASAMTLQQDLNGVATGQQSNVCAILAANSATDRIAMQFVSLDTAARTWFFTAQYVVK